MSEENEVTFGIGTILLNGHQATAVVVKDRVAPLADIVARHSTPGAVAPPMRDFLKDWDRWLDWLRGLGLDPAREEGWHPIDRVKFAAPVPEPWNIFHLYHNYERPSRVTGRSDPPKSERVLPDVFFGSRSALAGYGDTVYREHGGTQFDFEVEVTAVIGRDATRVSADRAAEYIAGYAIANDLTMHHAWWRKLRETSAINDNIRMKNFPGYTPMSRVIVPADLVGDPHDLRVRAWIDQKLHQDARTNAMLWHVGEVVEYLSYVMTLRPGDLILLGSPANLPLEPGQKSHGIEPGQTVTCEVEKLGRIVNPIAEQEFRQPNER
ncbi:MAG TPA: fumarylacetoacetate hydrolase family protein [Stellaceae bacterium]|nr:fumarylacetoacetate hydrolase family protein [Stellaceae bacterium]